MRTAYFSLSIAMLLSVRVGFSSAQECEPQWLPGDGVPGVSAHSNSLSNVRRSIVWDRDGVGPLPPMLVLAGSFDIAGDIEAGSIVGWDGTNWIQLGEPTPFLIVRSLGVWQNQLIAGNQYPNKIFRFDGETWHEIGGTIEGACQVYVFQNDLYIFGSFTQVGGRECRYFARWNGTEWSEVGGGLNGQVLAVQERNGELVITGLFDQAGSLSANRIVLWDGENWRKFPMEISGVARSMGIYEGDLLLNGSFGMFGGWRVLRLQGDEWTVLGDEFVGAHVVFLGFQEELYAGGQFIFQWNPSLTQHSMGFAKYNGTQWQPVPNESGYVASVESIGRYEGELVVCGDHRVNPNPLPGYLYAEGVVLFNGTSWRRLAHGFSGDIKAFALHDGDIIAGGSFSSAGTTSAASVARWDGKSWATFGEYRAASVNAIASFNGNIVLGGAVARQWTGTEWVELGELNSSVSALAVYQGNLIAGGGFTIADGQPVNHIALWDGEHWHPMGTGMNGSVRGFVEYNGLLVATGGFTTAGGVSVNGIAAWDGQEWISLNGGMGENSAGNAVTTYKGDLIVAGSFSTIGGVPAASIARWDGKQWHALGDGVNAVVRALCVHNGELIATGNFTLAGGVEVERIARWDGQAWRALSGAGLNNPGMALISYNDTLLIGGSFTKAGNQVSAYFARWGCPEPAPITGDINSDGVVDKLDLFAVIAAWGVCDEPCPADIAPLPNGDGLVNVTDLLLVISSWT